MEFWFLILMGRGQEYSKQPIFPNSAFYIEQKGAKNSHVLEVPVWSCGGLWRFLTGVSVPDHDGKGLGMSQRAYVPKFSFLHQVTGCKEPPCPRSPGLELWRTLAVPDWDSVPYHDGEESKISQTTYVPKFSFLHLIKRCKEPSCL